MTRLGVRTVYTFLWYLLLPWLPLRLWWRGRKEPGYRLRMCERFGHYAMKPAVPVLWVHAVSLGETRAAGPLVECLLDAFPQAVVLLTHMTATGRAAGAALADERVMQAWLPYDLPRFAEKFLRHFSPVAGMLVETEIWPNLIDAAREKKIPLFLVNARLSAQSAKGYARFKPLIHAALGDITGVAAQTPQDAERLAALGASNVVITGNLKFDAALAPALAALGSAMRDRFGRERPIWLAASTREGEEHLLLEAMARHPLDYDALAIIVPRHPQRFDVVARLLDERRLNYVRRSSNVVVPPDVHVVLGDSMGEIGAYCIAADVVLMGGSLLPLGGHNLIEPLALGKPTVVGPHMFNFAAATASAVAAGAVLQVDDADAALAAINMLLTDTRRCDAMRAAAATFYAAHAGAENRLWEWLAPQLHAAMRSATPRADD